MTIIPIAWPEAQRICDIPEVREALDKFAADAHEENMLAMVSAIMGHAVTQGRAAGLEEERAAFEAWVTEGDDDPFMKQRAISRGNTGQYLLMQTAVAWNVWQSRAAISSLPSEEARVRAYAIYRTNLEENDGKEFFYYAMWHNDTVPGNGERIVPGYFTPDAALSSLEVIGKGEKG